jgi:small subunit ribosomal protein S6
MATALNGYELTFIMKSEVSDDQQKAFLEKLKGIVAQHNGEVLVTEDWGRRKLAYPIQKEQRGAYHHLVFSGDNGAVAEIERNMRINESVLRFLTVKLGSDFKASEYTHRSIMNAPARPMERGGYSDRYSEEG